VWNGATLALNIRPTISRPRPSTSRMSVLPDVVAVRISLNRMLPVAP
jgi:hypothetical protein